MSFISTRFVFDGIHSEDMGIHLIKTSSGMIEKQFSGEREILSEIVLGNNTPYYFGQRINPLRLKLILSPLEGEWTSELKSSIMRWLSNGKFNEFYSVDDVDRRYFLTYIGSPTLSITGLNQGWLEIEFQNMDCYVRSPVLQNVFDLSKISTPTIIEVENLGDTVIYPTDLYIQKIGTGDVSIKNLIDGGREFKFTGLENNEEIYVNNIDRYIKTSVPNIYRYDSFNGNYLRLKYGVNRLLVEGKCKLNIEYRYEYLSQ